MPDASETSANDEQLIAEVAHMLNEWEWLGAEPGYKTDVPGLPLLAGEFARVLVDHIREKLACKSSPSRSA